MTLTFPNYRYLPAIQLHSQPKNLPQLSKTLLPFCLNNSSRMALFTSISASPLSVSAPIGRFPLNTFKRFTHPIMASSLSSPSSPESKSSTASQTVVSSNETSANAYPAPSRPPEPSFNYAFANGNPFTRFAKAAESSIERVHELLLASFVFANYYLNAIICSDCVGISHLTHGKFKHQGRFSV